MSVQYFKETPVKRYEQNRHMELIVEQGHEAVHSESYRTMWEMFNAKVVLDGVNKIYKARMETYRFFTNDTGVLAQPMPLTMNDG